MFSHTNSSLSALCSVLYLQEKVFIIVKESPRTGPKICGLTIFTSLFYGNGKIVLISFALCSILGSTNSGRTLMGKASWQFLGTLNFCIRSVQFDTMIMVVTVSFCLRSPHVVHHIEIYGFSKYFFINFKLTFFLIEIIFVFDFKPFHFLHPTQIFRAQYFYYEPNIFMPPLFNLKLC